MPRTCGCRVSAPNLPFVRSVAGSSREMRSLRLESSGADSGAVWGLGFSSVRFLPIR